MEMGYLVEALESVSRSLGWAFWGRDNLLRGTLAEVFLPKDTVTQVFFG